MTFERLGVELGSGHSFARETVIRHITIRDRNALLQSLILLQLLLYISTAYMAASRGSFLVFCSAPLRSIRLATLLNYNRERRRTSVARIIMGCECFLMRAEWRTPLDS